MVCLACRREATDQIERKGHACGRTDRLAGDIVAFLVERDRGFRVHIFVRGALSPVFTSQCMNREEAERYAARKREEIKQAGWTHRVEITS
jgi:hypothetical protein